MWELHDPATVPAGMRLASRASMARLSSTKKTASARTLDPPPRPKKTGARSPARRVTPDSFGARVAVSQRDRPAPKAEPEAQAWPFPVTSPTEALFKNRTGLTMPRSTAPLAEVDRWVQKLEPAQKLELLRNGGPLHVVEAVVADVAKGGGVLAHANLFSEEEFMTGLALQRENRQLSQAELSVRYHALASTPIVASYQPQMERLLRLEYLEKAIQTRFRGQLDLGDE